MTGRELSIVLLIVLGVVTLPTLALWSGFGGMMGWRPGEGMMPGWPGAGPGAGWTILLFLLLVSAAAVLLARLLVGLGDRSAEALTVLRRRLARGEITPDQYEALTRALTQPAP